MSRMILIYKLRECKSCGVRHDSGRKNCVICRIAIALSKNNWRKGQKAEGLCTECVERSYYDRKKAHRQIRCDKHRKLHNSYNQVYYFRMKKLKKSSSYGRSGKAA